MLNSFPRHLLWGKKLTVLIFSHSVLLKSRHRYAILQYEIQKTREGELLLIKLREKANLFNRICADDCDLTDEEITRLLDEAREEDSKVRFVR